MLTQPNRGTLYVDQMDIGTCRSLTKQVTDADIQGFAQISSDHNPVHLDDAYAETTMFGGRISHGMLTASLISAVIGEQLPGHGTVYLEQNLKFRAPVRPGDRVTAEVEVAEIDAGTRVVTLNTRCVVDGKPVLTGQAKVLAPAR